jgi:hypothetical protein
MSRVPHTESPSAPPNTRGTTRRHCAICSAWRVAGVRLSHGGPTRLVLLAPGFFLLTRLLTCLLLRARDFFLLVRRGGWWIGLLLPRGHFRARCGRCR